MGFDTVAIAGGKDKEKLARTLGARRYLNSQSDDVAGELAARGGARVILATVTSAKAMTAVIDGLAVDGKLLVIGAAAEPIEVSPFQFIGRRASIQGWPSGVAADSEETLSFSAFSEPQGRRRRTTQPKIGAERSRSARLCPGAPSQARTLAVIGPCGPRQPSRLIRSRRAISAGVGGSIA
jgi:NADPH:quinone reductase-like Zn-dependent oxidoreductase